MSMRAFEDLQFEKNEEMKYLHITFVNAIM